MQLENKIAVFCYVRMNPPTLGHQKLIQLGTEAANQLGGNFYVFPTHNYTPKKCPKENKNPLDFKTKMYFLTKMFPGTKFIPEQSQTLFNALDWLLKQGYKHVYMIAGEDRTIEFENKIKAYIPAMTPGVDPNKAINFELFKIISAGKRCSISNDIMGISGSKARKFVIDGKLKEFTSIIPGDKKTKIELYEAVKKGLGV